MVSIIQMLLEINGSLVDNYYLILYSLVLCFVFQCHWN
uniref:Uncharacterized protein n=1 Tax=Nelumbo nucifera TaxID=4432 RepID=A0A822Z9R6_NELNU|nr:TPA_asm: hypothetical protein HUJ06_014452 [Nelumbo nucifera]